MDTNLGVAGETEIKVFISSPGDVEAERIRAAAALAELSTEFAGRFKFVSVRWEDTYYSAHKTFQAAIPTPSSCDIVVCVLWKRLGSDLPPEFSREDGTARTGTEYEFEEALEAALKIESPDILVYKKKTKILFEADRVEQEQAELRALNAFWQKWFRDEQGHFTAGFDSFDTTDEFVGKLKRHLRQWLARRSEQVVWPIEVKGSPFRGLEAFDTDHAEVFFGRRRSIRQVVARLQTSAIRGCAFLAVLGMSGAGKSSLVRAGVLPWLKDGRAVAEIDEWRWCVVRPATLSADPVHGLVDALFETGLPELAAGDQGNRAALADLAVRAPDAVARSIGAALHRVAEAAQRRDKLDRAVSAKLVLVVDQLEELLARPAEIRDTFLTFIESLARSGFVWVIATVRSDFYPEIQASPRMIRLKEDGGSFDLLPPGPADIREIIEGPARAAGLSFEQREDRNLVDLLEAAALEPGSLPLLEFTLESLFEQRDAASKTLLLSVYDALGGLEGAISEEAERLVAGLPDRLQAALPALLLLLVDVDEAKETATARTILRSEVTDPAQIEVARLLVEHRFLVADGAGPTATLRLAHEALLAHWPRLSALVSEHFDFLGIRRRLQREAATWIRQDRHSDFLLPTGRRLAEADDALARRRADLGSGVVAYVEASLEAEHGRQETERQREEDTLRRELEHAEERATHADRLVRRTRMAIIVTSSLLVVVGGFAALWLSQRHVAQERAIEAEKNATEAQHNYQLALDAATKTIAIVEQEHDAGGVSTTVARSMLNVARDTFGKLSNNQGDAAAAAAQLRLFDALALSYLALGNSQSALDAVHVETGIATGMAEKEPANLEVQRNLGVAHERQGEVLLSQNDLDGALKEYRAELGAASTLATTNPANTAWQRDLAVSHQNVGDVLQAQGDLPNALTEYRQEMTIVSQLAGINGSGADLQQVLAVGHERIGDVLQKQGDLAGAQNEYQAEQMILMQLAAADGTNATWQRDLAVGHKNIGDLLMANHDPANALREYQADLTIMSQLAGKDPTNMIWQRDLSVAHEQIGDALAAQHDMTGALREYQADLTIASQLVAKDASNISWQKDLAGTHEKLANTYRLQGDSNSAIKEYRALFALAESWAGTKAPDAAAWQRRLRTSHERLGDLLQAAGNTADALKEYQAALTLAVSLATQDPSSGPRQRDLAIGYGKVGDMLRLRGDLSGASNQFQQCLGVQVQGGGAQGADTSLKDIQDYCRQRVTQLGGQQANTAK